MFHPQKTRLIEAGSFNLKKRKGKNYDEIILSRTVFSSSGVTLHTSRDMVYKIMHILIDNTQYFTWDLIPAGTSTVSLIILNYKIC